MKKFLSLIIIFSFIVMVAKPIGAVTDASWEDSFDDNDLSDWELGGGGFNSEGKHQPDQSDIVLEGGTLTDSSNSEGFQRMDYAIHSSSVAYGTWEFDWIVKSGSDHKSYVSVPFIYNDPLGSHNWTDLSAPEISTRSYALVIASSDFGEVNYATPGISLIHWTNPDGSSYSEIVLKKTEFDNDIDGSHTIKVTRDLTGEFNVYFDTEKLFTTTNNQTTTSEYFIFNSFNGDSSFDNLTVKTNIDSPGPNSVNSGFLLVLFPTIILVVFIRKKWR